MSKLILLILLSIPVSVRADNTTNISELEPKTITTEKVIIIDGRAIVITGTIIL